MFHPIPDNVMRPPSERLQSAGDARTCALSDLRRIPGVGPATAGDLWRLGVTRVADLRGADPRALYDRLCAMDGVRLDRCVLYVFRCAVYFASEAEPEPDLLRWWAWKDRPGPGERMPATERGDAR
jgi:hypothetical protein